jgi:hypothetical protein
MSLQVHERRRGYRQKANASAILRPLDGTGEPLEAHVFELSMHGAGLSVRQALEVGSIFEFEMSDGRQSGGRIEVRSCRARADNMFDVGGQFC